MNIIKLRDSTPDWLYFRANIKFENLKEIQDELLNIFLKITDSDIANIDPSFNMTIDIPMIRKQCPGLMLLLKKIGLEKHLESIAFISAKKDTEFPIHVDGTVDFALNIPVLNCENSYTAWYYSEIGNLNQKAKEYGSIDDYSNNVVLLCDSNTAIEITRINANIPHWININVPHRPIILSEGSRVNASLRFNSKILINGKPPKHLICL